MGGPVLAPLMNGRVLPSVVGDGSEPRLVSYLSQTQVLSVACGKNHMLAITDNGVSVREQTDRQGRYTDRQTQEVTFHLCSPRQIYGWGNSRYGQVGTGSTGRCPRPTLLAALEGKGIISVACGQFHSLAVSEDGT